MKKKQVWEITFIDNCTTVYWSTRKCYNHFGKEEFLEIAQGYTPHIVAVKVDKDSINNF